MHVRFYLLIAIHALTCQIELSCYFRILKFKDSNEFLFYKDSQKLAASPPFLLAPASHQPKALTLN